MRKRLGVRFSYWLGRRYVTPEDPRPKPRILCAIELWLHGIPVVRTMLGPSEYQEAAVALLERLVAPDPVCRSDEGLDDGCHWCDAPAALLGPGFRPTVQYHEADCPWMAAVDLLGYELPLHAFRPVGDGPVR